MSFQDTTKDENLFSEQMGQFYWLLLPLPGEERIEVRGIKGFLRFLVLSLSKEM